MKLFQSAPTDLILKGGLEVNRGEIGDDPLPVFTPCVTACRLETLEYPSACFERKPYAT